MQTSTLTAFTRKMYDLCDLAPKRVKGYYPSDFRLALEHSGDDFSSRAKEFLRTGLQSGLARLAQGNAIDITMEWSIAYDKWPEFNKEDRQLAYDRLVLICKLHQLPAPPPLN